VMMRLGRGVAVPARRGGPAAVELRAAQADPGAPVSMEYGESTVFGCRAGAISASA
jgi:hypothetical protein